MQTGYDFIYKFGFHALFPGESPADSREFHLYPTKDKLLVPKRQKNKRGQWAVSDPLIGGGGAVEEAEQFPRRNEELLSMGRIWDRLTGQRCAKK